MQRAIATLMLLVLPLTACYRWTEPEVRPDVGAGVILGVGLLSVATGGLDIGSLGTGE